MIDLSGKNILMLGGLNSVALGAAESLRQAGATLILTHPPHESPDEALAQRASQINATFRAVDLKEPVMLQKQIAAMGRIDGAILCPGWYAFAEFLNTTNADWDAVFEQNFEQMIYAAQGVAKHLITQGSGGSIVVLSSVASMLPLAKTSAVGTALSALWATMKMAAVDLAPYHITVNIAAAGWVESEWYQPFLHDAGRDYVQHGIPLGRVGTAADIGALCCFLFSDLAQYITGAVIPVDGGYVLTPSAGNSPYPEQG
jgi:glucose 1-dehydrogenase